MADSSQILEFLPKLRAIRRDFHKHPELSTQEFRTGKKICQYLDSWNISYKYPVADTGVTAILHGNARGRANTVALRADMDALPLAENKAHSCCSESTGVMHACGHDAHMTIALGTAFFLSRNIDNWSGTVKFFFQPAEETCGGAQRMIDDGCMENPAVDFVTGLHVTPAYKNGEVEVRFGKLNASSDEIIINIHGKSAHGAYPESGIDAIVTASLLISSLQTVISRTISPLEQAVLTFGMIEGGTAGNILAGSVCITGTLRTTDEKIRRLIIDSVKQHASHICSAHGCSCNIIIRPGYDALINTDSIVELLIKTASEEIGRENIHIKEFPGMGVEDFSFFLKHAPGVFYHLGCRRENDNSPAPLHSEDFDIDENCLVTGVRMQLALTYALLNLTVS